ncbi:cordon-bleu protein-like 1 isoform X4 [Onthophagus taurus]|uniref:cordon-bleu protein-like 1 isoform X4 n=1 Tax=Onthophagus taurus TaxID=166361 RepID=UPI0039BE9370
MLATNVLCLKKKRKKKSYYVANVAQYGGKQSVDKRSPRSTVTMMHITEDTPPDMLAGAMDLTVHLPTGRCVKLSVERSTPMMDLLVQITTVHNLQLSGHILEAMDMTRSGGVGERVLPYKPNTPIGALDTQHIKVVPKNKTSSGLTKVSSLGHQPFESTFRLKVHLPRNQLYVTRVSQSVYLEEIIKKVCEEKGLDPAKYELRHPGNLDEVLDPNLTLSDYQITEIYVVGKGSGRLVQTFSSSDIMALRKEEERKQFQAKTGGGVFNLIFKRPKSIIQEPPLTHQIDRTENTKSLPPPVTKEPPQERPKPPQRKRRPAPKPPMPTQQQPIEAKNPTIETTHNHIHPPSNGTGPSKTDNGLIISHSRNSSDSSGYHEASVLSENCNTSLPRRPKSIYDENGNRAKLNNKSSSSNLEKMQSHSKSMSSLGVLARKKKAAPPPPKPIQKEVDNVETTISPVVASQPIETIPESITTNITTNNSPPESPIITTIQPQITPNQDEISSLIKEDEIVVLKNQVNLENKMELSDLDHKNEVDSGICENNLSDTPEKEDVVEKGIEEVIDKEDVIKKEENIPENLQKEEIGCIEKVENINDNKDNENNEKIKDNIEKETEWKYQLPSPPKGFRDVSPAMRTCNYTSCDSETISDSVVTSPELFEKLKQINDVQSIASDIPSVISQEEIYEEKDICNKLTLENLEKRKSLVYKRELATSLKYAQSETNSDKRSTTKSDVLDELEDVIKNEKPNFLKNNVSKPIIEIKHDRHLPNFKISTYDGKKEKINIFEDETIRSSDKFHRVTENDADKNQKNLINENVVNRSESFSGSKLSLNPVRRSKSQVGFSKYNEKPQQINTESVSRSNSLLDVSGLQSLEVMKIIQNKLTNSKDAINTSDQEKNPSISEKSQRESPIQELPDKKIIEEPIQTSSVATKRQYFQGPPCIELGSWSQRPKTEVTLKEDTDYKFGMGLKPTPSSSSVYLNSTSFNKKPIGTSIKIGSDNNNTVTTTVININNDQKESERVTNQFRNDIFRKPFQKNPRPHSIAIDNHIPIVRSVELKKQFQDLPPTINNVIHFDNNQPKSLSYLNLNKESTRKEPMLRPVIRNNSFNPVVKGFRIQNSNDFYGTLPSSNKNTLNNTNTESNSNNKPNMFSQTNLRRTESASGKPIFGNVVLRNNSNNMKHVKPDQRHSLSVIPPPPPPVLPTLKPVKKAMNNNAGMSPVDNRNQLLLEIRNFGGKKGLKSKK